jgi:hypothetical protein
MPVSGAAAKRPGLRGEGDNLAEDADRAAGYDFAPADQRQQLKPPLDCKVRVNGRLELHRQPGTGNRAEWLRQSSTVVSLPAMSCCIRMPAGGSSTGG